MMHAQSSRNTAIVTVFKQVGPLRVLYAAFVVLCMLMVFLPDDEGSGWYVLSVHVAPALVILNIWVILLDLLVSTVVRSQKEGHERLRFSYILLWDVCLLVALIAFWGPFFASLLSGL